MVSSIIVFNSDEKQDWLYLGRFKTVAEKLKKQKIDVYAVSNKSDPELVQRLKIHQLGQVKFIRNSKLYVFKQDKQDHVNGKIF